MRSLLDKFMCWLVLFFGLSGICGCKERPAPASRDTRPKVRVTRPLVQKVTDYTYFTGRTEAIESVNVQARVTGYLDSIDFESGSEVKAKQRLFRIDPRPYQATLDEATGQVDLMQARLKLAIADYARALEIAKTPGAISQQDVDKYAAARDEAQAAVAAAKANCERARLNLEFTSVTSPVDGLVGRNLLTIGNLVNQDQTLLTTVVSQDPMYAYFDIDDRTMLRIERLIAAGKIGRNREKEVIPVEMGLADEGERYPHSGEIDFVNNRIDPSTGTLQLRGKFPNPKLGASRMRLLKPDLFVRIRLPLGEPYDAILVPEAAIGTDQGRKYLLVVDPKGVIEYRPIELGSQQPGALQVVVPVKVVRTEGGLRVADQSAPPATTLDSIRAGERVVVGGLQRVRPGMEVEAVEDKAASEAVAPVTIRVKDSASK